MTKTGTKRMGMVCANRDHDLSKCKIENGSYHFLPFCQNHFEGLTFACVFSHSCQPLSQLIKVWNIFFAVFLNYFYGISYPFSHLCKQYICSKPTPHHADVNHNHNLHQRGSEFSNLHLSSV